MTLNDANTGLPHFTAPFVSAAKATLKFQLTVSDGFDGASSSSKSVTVVHINDPSNVANAMVSICRICDGHRHGHDEHCDKKCDGKRHHNEACEHQTL